LFGYNLAIVSFTPKMTDVSLLRAFRSLNDNHDKKKNEDEKKLFFVLEDMDCIFNKNRTSSEELHCSLTFSGVLNALDGITSDNKIGFISTNHIEQLNKALIRPGRIDYILKFDYATKEQIIMMFNKFTGNQDKEVANEFYNGVCTLNIKVSTSLLQQYLLNYHDSKPIDHLDELKKMYDSSNVQKEADEIGLYN
jgi:chaperone BCS1